jgi:hypothetical protein
VAPSVKSGEYPLQWPLQVVLLCITWGFPRGVTAQTQLEVAPYVGVYLPTNSLASSVDGTVKQQSSVTLGMRVTRWWPGRRGFEVSVGYAPSSVMPSMGTSLPAHVLTVSAKVLWRVTPPASRAGLHVGGGVGIVGHGGPAYSEASFLGSRASFGGAAVVGGVVKLASLLQWRFDAEDFAYFGYLTCQRTGAGGGVCGGQASGPTPLRLQNDVVLAFGFTLSL